MTRTVWLLAPVLALVLLPSNVVATALPLLRDEWQASAWEMGWVIAAYQVGYVAAVLLILPLTDRVPIYRIIGACALAASAAFLLFPVLADGVWSASLLRVLAGAALAGVYLPGVRVVAATAAEGRRGLAVSAYVSAFYLGSALSLWATGLLLPSAGWRGAAAMLAAVSLAALPLGLAATRSAPRPTGASGRLRLDVLRHEPVLRTIMAYTAHSWELYVSRSWLAAFLAAVLAGYGLDSVAAASEGGKWAALLSGLGTAGVWLGGWISDRLGRAPAAVSIALASGLLSLGFGWLGLVGWPILIVVGCLYGLLMAADSGVYSTAVTEHAPPGQLGSAQAAQAFIGFTASVIAPPAAGLVLDYGGGFGGVFVMAGTVGLGSVVALLPLARAERLRYRLSSTPPGEAS